MLKHKRRAESAVRSRRNELREAMKALIAEGGTSRLPSRQLSSAVSAARSGSQRKRELQARMMHVLLAERRDDLQVVGTVTVSRKQLAPASHARKEPAIYLANLTVLPEERRQGTADRLMDEAERTARRWHSNLIYLNVDNANQPARRLYNARGYRKVREDKSLLPTPRSTLLCKELHQSKGE